MSASLAGKKILITGASSGIGRATARIFAKEGATVCATGRNEDSLRSLSAETGCHYVVADISQDDVCAGVVKTAVEKLGGLTTLVNCAGILIGGAVDTTSMDVYRKTFDTNTKAVFEMISVATPHLKENEDGASIVNISSVNGQQSFANCAVYCASKAAVDMFTKCAAVDLAPYKIRVNSVNPGATVTPLQRTGGMSDEQYEAFLARAVDATHPLAKNRGTLTQPEDVGELISFLVSDKAKWITGDCIAIDGGRLCLGAR